MFTCMCIIYRLIIMCMNYIYHVCIYLSINTPTTSNNNNNYLVDLKLVYLQST